MAEGTPALTDRPAFGAACVVSGASTASMRPLDVDPVEDAPAPGGIRAALRDFAGSAGTQHRGGAAGGGFTGISRIRRHRGAGGL